MVLGDTDSQNSVPKLPPKRVSRGSPLGVVVKSLAEIRREKARLMQQHATATDETQTKQLEPLQRHHDSTIKLHTSPGIACLHIPLIFISITFSTAVVPFVCD